MTRYEKLQYQPTELLRQYLNQLLGQKFTLDCGHHLTLGYFLGNDFIIRNGKALEIICLECGR